MADKNFIIKNGFVANGGLVFANNGQVGINTQSPDANLSVIGTANVSSNVRIGGNTILGGTVAVTGPATFSNTLNGFKLIDFVTTNAASMFTNVITFNSNLVVNSGLIANGFIGSPGQVLVSNGSGTYWGSVNATSGIAITNPNGYIQISKNNGLYGNSTFTWDESTGTLISPQITVASSLYAVSNGSVGIGVSTPGYRLSVYGNRSSDDGINLRNTSAVAGAKATLSIMSVGATGLNIGQVYSDKSGFINLQDPATLVISTNNATRMTILANGGIGIACTSPQTALDVTGTVTGTTFQTTGGNLIANSSGLFFTVGANTVNINSTSFSGSANNSSYLGGIPAANYITSGGLGSNIATILSSYLPTYVGIVNASSFTVGGSLVANSTQLTAPSISIGSGAFIVNATSISFSNTMAIANIVAGLDTTAYTGVTGKSGTANGVWGRSNTATGVWGQSNSGTGVYAQSKTGVPFAVANDSAEFCRVTPTGQFAVNTASHSYTIHAVGTIGSSGAAAGFYTVDRSSTGNAGFYRAANVTVFFDSTYGNVFSFGTNGRVGIGTTAPTYTLDVNGTFKAGGIHHPGGLILNSGYSSAQDDTFYVNYSGYQDGISYNRNTMICDGKHNNIAYFQASDKSLYVVGNIVGYWSDVRLKIDFQPIDPLDSLTRICQLDPVRHGWNYNGQNLTGHTADWREDSLIAQEVQTLFPEAVVEKPMLNGQDYLSINESKLIPHLINAIKELKREIDELKAR